VIINSRNPLFPSIRISTTHELDLVQYSEENTKKGIDKRGSMLSILEDLENKHPNAVYGYSSDLAELWVSDKEGFINCMVIEKSS